MFVFRSGKILYFAYADEVEFMGRGSIKKKKKKKKKGSYCPSKKRGGLPVDGHWP